MAVDDAAAVTKVQRNTEDKTTSTISGNHGDAASEADQYQLNSKQ